jgi:hypothetical protein
MHTYGLKESKEENSYAIEENENTSTLKPT